MGKAKEEKKESLIHNFRCKNCNTVFSTQKSLKTTCINCNGRLFEDVEYIKYSDYKMLPFTNTLEEAEKKYRSIIRFNPFVPSIFRKKNTLTYMKKIYLPCMLYSAKVAGYVSFLGTDKIKNINNIPTQTYEVCYQTNIDYDNALFSCYKDITDDMISEINQFNYTTLADYNEQFIQDAYLVPIEKNIEDMEKDIKEKMMNVAINTTRGNVEHQLKKIQQNNLTLQFKSIQKVFVPIYYLKVNYQNKDYVFIMNDHTGEVYYTLANSIFSIVLSGVLLFIVILAILIVFYCLI